MSDKKYVPIDPEDHDRIINGQTDGLSFEMALYNAGYQRGKEEALHPSKCAVNAVWVKATERLPDKGGINNKVIVRGVLNEQGYANHFFVAYGFRNFSKEKQEMYFEYGSKSFLTNDLEWLDESPSLAPDQKSETVFVPCERDHPQAIGTYASFDGQSLCYVREVQIPFPNQSGKEDAVLKPIEEPIYRGPAHHCKACENEAKGIKHIKAEKHTCRKKNK